MPSLGICSQHPFHPGWPRDWNTGRKELCRSLLGHVLKEVNEFSTSHLLPFGRWEADNSEPHKIIEAQNWQVCVWITRWRTAANQAGHLWWKKPYHMKSLKSGGLFVIAAGIMLTNTLNVPLWVSDISKAWALVSLSNMPLTSRCGGQAFTWQVYTVAPNLYVYYLKLSVYSISIHSLHKYKPFSIFLWKFYFMVIAESP